MTKNRGMTLVELMILIAVIGVVAALVVGVVFRGCVTGQSDKLTSTAQAFGASMGLKVQHANCVDRDSDGDGYVSCTLSVADKDGSTRLMPVECATSYSFNTGCRLQKPSAVVNER